MFAYIFIAICTLIIVAAMIATFKVEEYYRNES